MFLGRKRATGITSGLSWRGSAICGATILSLSPLLALGSVPGRENDLCAGAIPLTVPSSTQGSTVGATVDDSFPPCGGPIGAGIWYRVTGTGGEIAASLCDPTFDTQISVFSGDCANAVCLGGNDDACAFGSQLAWCSEEGKEYLLLVHGFQEGSGDFALELSDGPSCRRPRNDGCADALDIDLGEFPFSSVGSLGDGPAASGAGSDVWFTHTATYSGILTISTCNQADYDTVLAVYPADSGCPPSVSSLVACNDDVGLCGLTSTASFAVDAGATYLLQVGGFADSQGTGILSLSATTNDDCAAALSLSEGAVTFATTAATVDGGAPCGSTRAVDVWYLYTPSCSGDLTASTCASQDPGTDTILAIYDADSGCPPLPALALGCSDDACGPGGFASSVTVSVTADEPYLIQVANPPGQETTGTLTLELLADTVNPCVFVENCGFERGSFGGEVGGPWRVQDLPAPFFPATVAVSGVTADVRFFASAPPEGCFAAIHGFDGSGPGIIQIGQDIDLPPFATTLEFRYRGAWDMTFGATENRAFEVRIEPPGGGPPLHSELILTASAGETNLDTGNLTGNVDLAAFAGETVHLNFCWTIPEHFTGPGFFQLDGVDLTPSCDGVTGLKCASLENDIILTWANTDTYDAIRILRDGTEISLLPGEAATFTDLLLPPGTYAYDVVGECAGARVARPAMCVVAHAPPCKPVTNLLCITAESDVALSWNNEDRYQSIRVFRDSVEIATLPGEATTFADHDLPAGFFTYEVAGNCGTGVVARASACALRHTPPCAAVTKLACVSSSADVVLSWNRQEQYESIQIFRNSEKITTLPGETTVFVDLDLPAATYTYAVVGTCPGDIASSEAVCTVTHHPSLDFIRGDADGNGVVNGLVDTLYILEHQFQGGPAAPCLESADTDGDGVFNGLSDALYLLEHQFQGGAAPPAPYPDCGPDPRPAGNLGCRTHPGCR